MEQIQFREVLCFHESYENGRRNGLSLSPPLNFSLGSASEADIRRIRVTPSPESNPSHPSHDHVTTRPAKANHNYSDCAKETVLINALLEASQWIAKHLH